MTLPHIQMFVSMPQHEFKAPDLSGTAGAKFWRSVFLSGLSTVYVLTISGRNNNQAQTTLFLARDLDVIDAIESMDANVESLMCLVPVYPQMTRLTGVNVRAIWEGVDMGNGELCGIFVDDVGTQRSGQLLLPNESVSRARLITIVGGGSHATSRAQ